MVYTVLLAGGMGTRLGLPIPKQFLKLGERTLLEHSIEKFSTIEDIAYVVVVVPEDWYRQSEEIVQSMNISNVSLCTGGKSRQESLFKGLLWLSERFSITKDDIVVSHDVARPFVTSRMIHDNINVCRIYGAADTVISSPDTIVQSTNKTIISRVPIREEMYLGQTPQTFYIQQFIDIYKTLSEDYLNQVTDAARILSDHEVKVGLVNGDPSNMKITTMFDLDVANSIVKKSK